MKIILLGSPGSGKSSLCPILREKYAVCHISAADIVEDAITAGSHIARDQQQALRLRRGESKPIDEALAMRLAIEAIRTRADCSKGFVLDGMPMSSKQAKQLRDSGIHPDALIVFEAAPDVVVQRLAGRWIHPPSGRIYHDVFCPPRTTGVDDYTHEPLEQRPDDKYDAVQQRITTFQQESLEVRRFYGDKSLAEGEEAEGGTTLSSSNHGLRTNIPPQRSFWSRLIRSPQETQVCVVPIDDHSLNETRRAVSAILDPIYDKERSQANGWWLSRLLGRVLS